MASARNTASERSSAHSATEKPRKVGGGNWQLSGVAQGRRRKFSELLFSSRNANTTEKRPALQCTAAQEAGAGQADWTHRCGDVGVRRGARALGDPSFHRKVCQPQTILSFLKCQGFCFFYQSTNLILLPSPFIQQAREREVAGYRFLQDYQQSEDIWGREGAPGESAEAGQDGCPAGGSSGLGDIGLTVRGQPLKHIAAIQKRGERLKGLELSWLHESFTF